MKLYVVIFESGRIYAIYSSKAKAQKQVAELQNLYYENATIQEHRIEY